MYDVQVRNEECNFSNRIVIDFAFTKSYSILDRYLKIILYEWQIKYSLRR